MCTVHPLFFLASPPLWLHQIAPISLSPEKNSLPREKVCNQDVRWSLIGVHHQIICTRWDLKPVALLLCIGCRCSTTTTIVALHCCNTVVVDLLKVAAHPVALLPQNLISLFFLLLYCSFHLLPLLYIQELCLKYIFCCSLDLEDEMSPQARSSNCRAMDPSALKKRPMYF